MARAVTLIESLTLPAKGQPSLSLRTHLPGQHRPGEHCKSSRGCSDCDEKVEGAPVARIKTKTRNPRNGK